MKFEGFDDWDIDFFTNFDKPKKTKKQQTPEPVLKNNQPSQDIDLLSSTIDATAGGCASLVDIPEILDFNYLLLPVSSTKLCSDASSAVSQGSERNPPAPDKTADEPSSDFDTATHETSSTTPGVYPSKLL